MLVASRVIYWRGNQRMDVHWSPTILPFHVRPWPGIHGGGIWPGKGGWYFQASSATRTAGEGQLWPKSDEISLLGSFTGGEISKWVFSDLQPIYPLCPSCILEGGWYLHASFPGQHCRGRPGSFTGVEISKWMFTDLQPFYLPCLSWARDTRWGTQLGNGGWYLLVSCYLKKNSCAQLRKRERENVVDCCTSCNPGTGSITISEIQKKCTAPLKCMCNTNQS